MSDSKCSHHAVPTPARNSYAAIIEPTAFGRLLRDINAYHGAPETRLALQLIALTALRPGELRQLRWSWIAIESTEPTVTLPAEIMKMRREHRIPLSRQAVALLAELRARTAAGEPHSQYRYQNSTKFHGEGDSEPRGIVMCAP